MTRAQAKQGSTKRVNAPTASSTFPPANCPNSLSDHMAPENLIVAQQNDATLVKLRNEAVSEKEIDNSPALYCKDGILTRFCRPPDLS